MLPLFGGVLCLVQYVMSFECCNQLDGEERDACFTFIVFLMSRDYKCSVVLPHGAVGWSAICDFGIS